MKLKKTGWFLLLIILSVPFQIRAEGPAAGEVYTLEQCLKLGYQNSRQLEVAAQNVAIAKAGVRQAYGGFWPTVNYSISDSNPPGPSGEPWSGYLELRVYLYNGGKTTTEVRLAQLKLESALEEQRKTKQQVIYNIKTTFYNLWLAQQMLVVAQSSYDNMGKHYEHVSKFNRLGLATKHGVLRAKIQWEKLKPMVMKAEHDLNSAKLKLANHIGLERTRQFKVEMDISRFRLLKSDAFNLAALLEEAYQKRPEMHQTEQQIQIAECNVTLAEAGYKPTIILAPRYSNSGPDSQSGSWNQTLNLTATLSGSLFDGMVTSQKVAAAKDSLKITKMNQTGLQDQIQVELESAVQEFKEAIETTNFNQANIDFAKESLRLTHAHFDAGMATSLDVMDAELNLDTTLNGYYQGISSYLIALAQLDLVSGKDIDENLYIAK